jgi:hypothetical protein
MEDHVAGVPHVERKVQEFRTSTVGRAPCADSQQKVQAILQIQEVVPCH